MSVRVRRLGHAEAPIAAKAVRSLRLPAAEEPDADERFRTFLSKPENVLIVAEEEGAPVGFLVAYLLDRVDRPQAMICLYEIEVAETRRRRGIGRALVEELLSLSGGGNVMKTWVVTDARNEAALRLYSASGGRPDAGDDVVFVWSGEA